MDVIVPDADLADDGFQLSLDGMMAEKATGTVASIGHVPPGLHKVSATARAKGKDYSASKMVNVTGGAICPVELTLGIPKSAQTP